MVFKEDTEAIKEKIEEDDFVLIDSSLSVRTAWHHNISPKPSTSNWVYLLAEVDGLQAASRLELLLVKEVCSEWRLVREEDTSLPIWVPREYLHRLAEVESRARLTVRVSLHENYYLLTPPSKKKLAPSKLRKVKYKGNQGWIKEDDQGKDTLNFVYIKDDDTPECIKIKSGDLKRTRSLVHLPGAMSPLRLDQGDDFSIA